MFYGRIYIGSVADIGLEGCHLAAERFDLLCDFAIFRR
jgi:hypothetical protein